MFKIIMYNVGYFGGGYTEVSVGTASRSRTLLDTS